MNGRVVKRGAGYQGVIYLGSEVVGGMRRQRRETKTFSRKHQADQWVRDRLTELERPSSDMPLWAWVGQYLDDKRSAPQTLATYRNYYQNHIRHSDLGKLPLSRLTADEVEAFEASLKMSPSSIRQVHAILRGSLRAAQRKGLVHENAAALVHPPKLGHYQPRVITPEQARLCVEAFDGWMRTAVLLAATTGMRRGEVCALRWEDVKEDYLIVRRSFVVDKGELVIGPTKSGRERAIPLLRATLEELRGVRERQALLASKTGFDYTYVVSFDTADPVRPGQVSNRWREGRPLPVRFHDLRHSLATTLARNGAHPRTVQEILGHSDVTTTLRIYTHVLSDVVKEDMGRLDEAWG